MTIITETFIAGLLKKSQEIPYDVMQQGRRVLLDYLGVLVGGKKYLEEKHPELIAAAPSEPFINGFAAHVLGTRCRTRTNKAVYKNHTGHFLRGIPRGR